MGIRYLQTFLKTYPIPLLEDIEVRDIPVVIDGSELLYYLCFEHGELDFRCGGEYTALREITVEFFDAMRKCNIKPYVIFDAFKSKSNLVRCLKRRTEKLVALREVVDGTSNSGNEKPLFGKYVLRQTLSELEVPYVIVPGDADPELAAIANRLGAPVLGGDTDFCIFDLKEGFLLIREFCWKELTVGGRPACRGKIFRRMSLINTFGISADAIACLVPIMSSQDPIRGVDFKNFLIQLSRTVRIPQRLRRNNFRRPNWIEVLLVWLASTYTSDDDIVRRIASQVGAIPEKEFKECVMMFRQLPNVDKYVDMLESDGRHADREELTWCTKVEGTGGGICFLPLVMDDQDLESANTISLPIRKALYEFATQRSRLMGDDADPRVIEMDRRRGEYGATPITVAIDEERLQPLSPDLDEPDQAVLAERKQYIFDVLLQNSDTELDQFESLGTGLDLLAATFKYWYTSLSGLPSIETCRALAFTFSACNDGIQESYLPDSFQKMPDGEFCKSALHYSTQWQCCVNDAIRLNQFLGYPASSPVIGKLFSGKLFQKANAYFGENSHLTDEYVTESLFEDYEDARSFYTSLMELVRA